MNSIRKVLMKILDVLGIFLVIFVTVIGTYQVVTRYFLNKPSAWSEELLTYAFTWLVFIGASIVFGKREHMRLTFVQDKFGSSVKKNIEIFAEITIILFAALIFVYGGFSIMKLTFVQTTPALQISTGFLYSILPITGMITIFFSICNIMDILNGVYDTKISEEA